MTRTTVFQSNRSQAVRLPKDVAFPAGVRAVVVVREGKRRVIVPADAVWDDFFDAPGIELPDREQPEAQNRATIVLAELLQGAAKSARPAQSDRG